MKYITKGFGVLNQFIDTVDDGIAPVGEISQLAYSYSNNHDILRKNDINTGHIDIFHLADESGFDFVYPVPVKNTMLAVLNRVAYLNDTDEPMDQLQVFIDNSILDIVNVTTGGTTTYLSRNIPQFVQFSILYNTDVYVTKLWFDNGAFVRDYDEYEIRVIPPVPETATTSTSSLFTSFDTASTALAAVDPLSYLNAVSPIQNGDPSTYVETIMVEYVDPLGTGRTLQVPWTVVGYGAQALYDSSKFEAIRNWLGDNAPVGSIDQWLVRFPGLDIVNEYTLIPLWDQPSSYVANLEVPFYRPIIHPARIMNLVMRVYIAKPETEVAPFVEFGSILHKGIGLVIVGKRDNDPSTQLFSEKYPDYTIVATANPGFNRLNEATRGVIRAMEELLRLAESDASESSPLPSHVTRETLAGSQLPENTSSNQVTVLSTKTGSIKLNVMTKESFENLPD